MIFYVKKRKYVPFSSFNITVGALFVTVDSSTTYEFFKVFKSDEQGFVTRHSLRLRLNLVNCQKNVLIKYINYIKNFFAASIF